MGQTLKNAIGFLLERPAGQEGSSQSKLGILVFGVATLLGIFRPEWAGRLASPEVTQALQVLSGMWTALGLRNAIK